MNGLEILTDSVSTVCHSVGVVDVFVFITIIDNNDSLWKSFNLRQHVHGHLEIVCLFIFHIMYGAKHARDERTKGERASERSVHCGCLNAIDQRVPSLVSLPSIIIQQSIFLRCILPHFDWHSKHRYHRRRRLNTKYNYVYIDFMHAIHFLTLSTERESEKKNARRSKTQPRTRKPNRP